MAVTDPISALRQGLSPAAAQILTDRALDRHTMAHDASHYLLTPAAVARPRDAAMVGELITAAQRVGLPIALRGGGTSLSGQAITSGLLVDVRRRFQDIEVLDDGRRVRVGCGATIRAVNARLAPFGRRLGPDPASESACTVGAVVANNSSGMQCGTTQNSYRTVESLVMVLPSGTVIDSADMQASRKLAELEPELHEGLLRLRRRIVENAGSVATLMRLFALKNTMGYGLNAFLDHQDPLDILVHLMVGSEGTLGFIAQATFATVPVFPSIATSLLVFTDLFAATEAVPALVDDAHMATAELLDASSLRVAQADPHCPDVIRSLQIHSQAALLVELQAPDEESLNDLRAGAQPVLDTLAGMAAGNGADTGFTTDPPLRASLWSTRKGLYSMVAGARPPGSNALLEDVAVPAPVLGTLSSELTHLLERHRYDGTVIFGHARDGNLHFMLNERFDSPELLRRYDAFTHEMVDLVLGLGGTLKAEHGTGRIMAPFVERQYGTELTAVMRELKKLIDPSGLLGQGNVLNDDPASYLRDLKTTPSIESEVDRCVECGFCEPVCPSRDLTLTPRGRIVARREMEAARAAGDTALAQELERDYEYAGVQTCAVDGMCGTVCPVHINTGDLVRRLRQHDAPKLTQQAWRVAAGHWDQVSRGGGLALTVADRVPAALPRAATTVARLALGADTVPQYGQDLPAGGTPRPHVSDPEPAAVLFAACIGTMFGGSDSAGALVRLAHRAGLGVRTPGGLAGLCCGTPWKSKGLTDGYQVMQSAVIDALTQATGGGRLPVVTDASSCTEGLRILLQDSGFAVVDAVEWVAGFAERLAVTRPVEAVVIHPTCSTTALGITDHLVALAALACGDPARVHVPTAWGCCGFAGDRGLLHPELTASATAPEAAEVARLVAGLDRVAFVSTNRTCEIGMRRATGRDYQHILDLLDDVTAPVEP